MMRPFPLLPTLLLQVLLPFIYSASVTVAASATASASAFASTVLFDYLINGLGRLLRKQTTALFYGWLIKQSRKGWEAEGERRRKAVGVLETGWHATDACEEIFT